MTTYYQADSYRATIHTGGTRVIAARVQSLTPTAHYVRRLRYWIAYLGNGSTVCGYASKDEALRAAGASLVAQGYSTDLARERQIADAQARYRAGRGKPALLCDGTVVPATVGRYAHA